MPLNAQWYLCLKKEKKKINGLYIWEKNYILPQSDQEVDLVKLYEQKKRIIYQPLFSKDMNRESTI